MSNLNSESYLPLISVIIPTLNEEKLLTRKLEQFSPELKQKYRIEVIISDGGSKDATLEISASHGAKIIEAAPGIKQNISIGRNEGAKNASGEFFCFMNADTLLENPDMFFKFALDAFSDRNTAAVTCKVKVFPEEEKLSDKLFHSVYNFYVRSINSFGMGMGRGECQMMRKEVFQKLRGYNELMPAGEDYDLYRRIKKFGKIKYLGNLTVFESPRRYRKYGYIKVFWQWTKNSLSVLLFNKASSKEWEQVR